MRKLAWLGAVLLGVVVIVVLTVLRWQAASAAPDCSPRTAWAGTEAANLSGTFVTQWPTAVPVRVTHVDVSWAYAPQHGAPKEFREALVLAGHADRPVTLDAEGLPPLYQNTDWSAGTMISHPAEDVILHDNPTMSRNVFLARILKTAGAIPSAGDSVSTATDFTIPAGGVLWVFAGTMPVGFDVEVQTVATYVPAGC